MWLFQISWVWLQVTLQALRALVYHVNQSSTSVRYKQVLEALRKDYENLIAEQKMRKAPRSERYSTGATLASADFLSFNTYFCCFLPKSYSLAKSEEFVVWPCGSLWFPGAGVKSEELRPPHRQGAVDKYV